MRYEKMNKKQRKEYNKIQYIKRGGKEAIKIRMRLYRAKLKNK